MNTTFDVSMPLVFRFTVVDPWTSKHKIEFDVGAGISDVVDGVRDELAAVYSLSRYVSLDDFLSYHYVRVSLHANGRYYASNVRMSENEYSSTDLLRGLLAAVMAGLVRDMLVHGTSREHSEVDYERNQI